MLKNWIGILAVAALVAACATPPQPDPSAVRIEGTPGSAVIYIIRPRLGIGPLPAQLVVNEQLVGTTYPGSSRGSYCRASGQA